MTDNQKRIIGAIVFVLVTIGIAVLLYLLFFRPAAAPAPEVTDEGAAMTTPEAPGTGLAPSGGRTPTPAPETSEPAPEVPEQAEPVRDDLGDVRSLASAFTERFGSFSTQSDYGNIVDLKVFMTPAMQAWADDMVEEARARGPSTVSFGITSRALIVDITELDADAGTASAAVTAQRMENNAVGEAYYQDLALEFRKIDEAWKVDSATWGEERVTP